MTVRYRVLTAVAATVLLAVVAVGYTVLSSRPAPAGRTGVTLGGPGLLVRDTVSGRLAVLPAGGGRVRTSLTCARVYAAGGTGVCLRGGLGSTSTNSPHRNTSTSPPGGHTSACAGARVS